MPRPGRFYFHRSDEGSPMPWVMLDRMGEQPDVYFPTYETAMVEARKLSAEAHAAYMASADKRCRRCDIVKPRTDFTRNATNIDGRNIWCRDCTGAVSKTRYFENTKFREGDVLRRRRYSRDFDAKHPEIKRAHQLMQKAIRRGELVRPEACSQCGAGGRIEGSHDDYSKPLEVVWLCVTCHRRKDRANPKSRGTEAA